MKFYPAKVLITASVFLSVHFFVSFYIWSPIQAEYWVPEMIVVKDHLINQIKSPKIIFAGGSNVLYNIDAHKVEEAIHYPCFNFGLHAAMRLDWLLDAIKSAVRPGDTVVLALEQSYYSITDRESWGEWCFRNAHAWRAQSLQNLNMSDKIQVLLHGGNLGLSFEIIQERLEYLKEQLFLKYFGIKSDHLAMRLLASKSDSEIIDHYDMEKKKGGAFPFFQKIDALGTVQQTDESIFTGKFVPADSPSCICPFAKKLLAAFIKEMKQRSVHVYFAGSPYGVDTSPAADWKSAEVLFKKEIRDLGSQFIEDRQDLFFPRNRFFNTALHMTSTGKSERTENLIKTLKKLRLPRN